MYPVIGIQARSTSTRLPGKCLMLLKGMPLWQWSYNACIATGYRTYMLLDSSDKIMIDAVLKVTSDVILAKEPLSRYKKLLKLTKKNTVIRITADCPLVNEYMITDMYNIYKTNKMKFLYNELDGMDVQIIHKNIFTRPWVLSEEHVVNMTKLKGMKLYNKYDMHLSIDTEKQLDYMQDLVWRVS